MSFLNWFLLKKVRTSFLYNDIFENLNIISVKVKTHIT